jgi:hypothetical protein
MSGTATTKMLEVYEQNRRPARFFSSLFNSPRSNFHSTEGVEIDIQRNEEKVAVAVTDLSAGYNFNKKEIYTNKRFIPPLFKEGFQLNNVDTVNRVAGQNPFTDSNYLANALNTFGSGMARVEDMIMRAVELQASQVLQTGTATLKNENGDSVYTIDYSPKASHFPTASPVWDGTNPTIRADLEGLMDQIRDDGKGAATQSIWGIDAFNAAMEDTAFRALYDKTLNTQADLPRLAFDGLDTAKFRGTVDIGHYPLQIWTYGDKYEDVETDVITPYMDPGKVIVMIPGTRLDMTWGNVPIILPRDPRLAAFASRIPPRIRRAGMGGVDMITNVWATNDGEHIFGGINARPLAIPTAIDRFGCIDSGV